MKWKRFIFVIAPVFFLASCGAMVSATSGPDHLLGQQLIDKPVTRGKIRVLSAIRLPRVRQGGLDMVELSGLAWSHDEKVLYTLSDHGNIFCMRPVFKSGMLSADVLSGVQLVNAFSLKGATGDPQVWPWHDSEGLVALNTRNGVIGDEELIVSYELRPRIQKHTSHGNWKERLKVPARIEDRGNYDWGNNALEAVAVHPDHGVLTVPEQLLNDASQRAVTVYAANGKQWELPQTVDSKLSVVALEAMPDGRLLILQRDHRIFGVNWTSVLTRLQLRDDGTAISEKLVELSSIDESVQVDNFEGLTHHEGNRYFMVSDGNEHPLQDTLLVYFEVLE